MRQNRQKMSIEQLEKTIRTIPDFPKEGITFRDITTLLKNGEAFSTLVEMLADELRPYDVDVIVAPEARGFMIGAAVAFELGKGFVPARKKGKLPCETASVTYDLEYGEDCLEIHADAIQQGMKIAIVDDLLATGGTAQAVAKLAVNRGASVEVVGFAIELTELDGRKALSSIPTCSIIKY